MKKIIIFSLGLLLMACASNKKDVRETSSQFRDGIFHNTNAVEMHSLWAMFKEFLFGEEVVQAKWPEEIKTAADSYPIQRIEHDGIRVTFINHATFLIQTAGFNILTDPVFSERTSPFSFVGPKRIHQPGIAFDDLPEIDVVIISHDHYDHLDLASVNAVIKRDNPRVFVGLGVGSRIDDAKNVTELDWWQSVKISDNFTLSFVDVQHFSGRTLTDRNTTLWGGYMLEINDKNIYFGGDSGYADHYKRTFERFGPTDLAFLPIGAYAPRKFFKQIHLNPEEAVMAHIELQSAMSIGMHYGTFQLTAEALTEPQEFLEKAKTEHGIASDQFITLNIGQPVEFPINSDVPDPVINPHQITGLINPAPQRTWEAD